MVAFFIKWYHVLTETPRKNSFLRFVILKNCYHKSLFKNSYSSTPLSNSFVRRKDSSATYFSPKCCNERSWDLITSPLSPPPRSLFYINSFTCLRCNIFDQIAPMLIHPVFDIFHFQLFSLMVEKSV